MRRAAVLELAGITKLFPGSLPTRHRLRLAAGEVHALLGENGAGQDDADERPLRPYRPTPARSSSTASRSSFKSPQDAIAAGIGMVHQHFMLVPALTVAENIVLGLEPRDAGVVARLRRRRARACASSPTQLRLAVDPRRAHRRPPVGLQQRVEILKALYRGADVLILDEPTAVLTPQEVDELFGVLRALMAEGKSIIFITHKLDEVLAVADRITRDAPRQDGRRRRARGRDEAGAGAADGRARGRCSSRQGRRRGPGDRSSRSTSLRVVDDRGIEEVRGIVLRRCTPARSSASPASRATARRELVDALAGPARAGPGAIPLAGATSSTAVAAGASTAGLAHIPEDRHRAGSFSTSRSPRTSAPRLREPAFARCGWLFAARLQAHARAAARRVRRPPRVPRNAGAAPLRRQSAEGRPGARARRGPRVLLAAHPTRGLDVGAIEFVHRRLLAERDAGRAVLLISLELDEILALADRILVMFEGGIVAEFSPGRLLETPSGSR